MAIDDYVSVLLKQIDSNDQSRLLDACKALIFQLSQEKNPIPGKTATKVLLALRNGKYFKLLRRMAQAVINDGCDKIEVHKLYAQALIEAGEIEPAIGILNHKLASLPRMDAQAADAYGVLGRAWKEKALKTRGCRDEISSRATKEAFNAYKKPYKQNSSRFYQGINLVAIAAWDDGKSLTTKQQEFAYNAAKNIFNQIESRTKDECPIWDLATAAEAALALGDIDRASEYFSDYIARKDITAFQLTGTVRQLKDLWELDNTEEGRELIAPLRARLLEIPGGSFIVSRKAIRGMEQIPEASYEKVLGESGALTYQTIQKGLKCARSVAMLKTIGNGRTFGTGFVVRGEDFHPTLEGERLILTNCHNVSNPVWVHPVIPNIRSHHPEEVGISFELLTPSKQIEATISKIVWNSPPDECDASLLRLTKALPKHIKPLDISPNLPEISGNLSAKVFVIGHPEGGEISFSFNDNELLDYDKSAFENENDDTPCRIHYKAPTTGGSSGSPVFNINWQTIGLHHSGSLSMKRLNNKNGYYPANEGIWLQSIRRAMKRKPPK